MMAKLRKVFVFINTIRYLKVRQIAYRIFYSIRNYFRLSSEIYNASFTGKINYFRWQAECTNSQSLFSNHVCFLNERLNIVEGEIFWSSVGFSKLFNYNLHYLDDLNSEKCEQRVELQYYFVKRWIAENKLAVGSGWEAYPLSLRLVNLIKWYGRSDIHDPSIISSIAMQANVLSKKLEFHIGGNHLFVNAKALIFAGCFLEGQEGVKHLKVGLDILAKEIPEQFLPDGGHFELSPMYHCIVLLDLLDLIKLTEITGNNNLGLNLPFWREYAQRSVSWLLVMIHPDNEISFFNDTAIGIAPSPDKIISYAAMLGLDLSNRIHSHVTTLSYSGYSVLDIARHRVFFDHAAVGPDYLPGHAHADTLSLEWSVGKQRIFVNSGTSLYGTGNERLRQRKTAAHNTVVVDGEDSSEVWSGFRVARRAYSKVLNTTGTDECVSVTASHDGYCRLRSPVVHQRTVSLSGDGLLVSDMLDGSFRNAVAHFHLHPLVKVTRVSSNEIFIHLPSGELYQFKSSVPCLKVASTWHPHFGISIPSTKITVPFVGPNLLVSVILKV